MVSSSIVKKIITRILVITSHVQHYDSENINNITVSENTHYLKKKKWIRREVIPPDCNETQKRFQTNKTSIFYLFKKIKH